MIINLRPDNKSEDTKCCPKHTNVDRKYTIDHIVQHVMKFAKTRYVMREYGYTAANDITYQHGSIQSYFITQYFAKQAQ